MLSDGGTATGGGRTARPDARRPRLSRSEWVLLLVLAAMQFLHIVDFVIVMPLGPAVKTALTLTNQQFGWMVSAYGSSASVTANWNTVGFSSLDRASTAALLWNM